MPHASTQTPHDPPRHTTHDDPIVQHAPPDIEMEALTESLESSLQFIPKGVRKKQQSIEPTTQ